MKIKTLLGSVLLASFTLVPVSAVLAEEATSTATTTPEVTVTVVATSTVVAPVVTTVAPIPVLYKVAREQAKEDFKKLFEQKKEEIKNIQNKVKEDMKNLREKQKVDLKDWKNASGTKPVWTISTGTASSTSKYEDRKAEQVKKNLENATADLLKMTTKLGTLGTQIKAIVAGQASSSAVIVTAMKNEEGRGFGRFLFGADYKNIGQIISEVAKTQARIVQLDNQVSKMSSSTEKTALLANTEVQKTEIVSLEQYVKDNINKFSLFGWFVQKFNK